MKQTQANLPAAFREVPALTEVLTVDTDGHDFGVYTVVEIASGELSGRIAAAYERLMKHALPLYSLVRWAWACWSFEEGSVLPKLDPSRHGAYREWRNRLNRYSDWLPSKRPFVPTGPHWTLTRIDQGVYRLEEAFNRHAHAETSDDITNARNVDVDNALLLSHVAAFWRDLKDAVRLFRDIVSGPEEERWLDEAKNLLVKIESVLANSSS